VQKPFTGTWHELDWKKMISAENFSRNIARHELEEGNDFGRKFSRNMVNNMKIEWKTCLRLGVSIFLLYLCIHYWSLAADLLLLFLSAAKPLLIGCIIAYLLNILMSFYEEHYFPKKTTMFIVKSRRIVCMLAAMLTLVGIVLLVIRLVIPELIACIQLLASEVPETLENILKNRSVAEFLPKDVLSSLKSFNWQERAMQIAKEVTSGVSSMFGAVATAVSSVFSALLTALFAFIFSIYVLLGKDRLKNQFTRLMKTYLKESWNQKICYVLEILNDCFHKYIVGQCVEAVILGTLCVLGMLLLRFPYATMIGTLVGFTALIPVAGAYIGAGVGTFMILTVSPMQAVLFLIFIAVLQQVEGNLIYPKVVGSSIGLPGMWVLAAVTIGGSLFGVLGMLIGVPMAAALYRILKNDMHRREKIVQNSNIIQHKTQ
jgi:predicted PurR-regulated permease PerM